MSNLVEDEVDYGDGELPELSEEMDKMKVQQEAPLPVQGASPRQERPVIDVDTSITEAPQDQAPGPSTATESAGTAASTGSSLFAPSPARAKASSLPGFLPNGRPMAKPHRPRPTNSKSKSSQSSQPPAPIPQSATVDFQPVTSAPSIPIFNPLVTNPTGIPPFMPRPPTVSVPSTQAAKPGPPFQNVNMDAPVTKPIFDPQNIPSLGIPRPPSPLITSHTAYRNAESDLIPFQRDVQIAIEGKAALKKELELKEIELQNKVQELAEANVQVSNRDKQIVGRNTNLIDQVQEINELEADIREQMREIDRLKGVIEERDEEIDSLKAIVEGRLEEDSDGGDEDDDMEMDDGGGGPARTKTLKLKQALNACEGKREMLEDVVKEQAEKIVQMQEVIEGKQIPNFWAKMREVQTKVKALEKRNQELEASGSEKLQDRIKELEAELVEAKDDAAFNLEDYETAKKLQDLRTNENKNLKHLLSEGEDKRSAWVKARVERLEEKNAALQAELEQKDQKIEELEHDASVHSMGQDHSVELQIKEEAYQKKLVKLKADYDAALKEKTVEIDRLVRKNQEMRKAHEVAEITVAQAQEDKTISEMNARDCRNENARLERDFATYRAQIEELQRQLAQAQQTQQNVANDNVEALNAQIRQMTEAGSQVVAERDAYLQQIEQLNAEVQRLNTLGMSVEKQRDEAYSNRDQVIKERDEMSSKLNDAMGQIANLQQQLQQSQQQVLFLQNQLAAAQENQHQPSVENVDGLLTEVVQLRQQLAHTQQAAQEVTVLQEEIVRLKEQVEIVQEAGEAVEAQREAAVEELAEAQKSHRMVRAELSDAKARVPGLESQVQELQAQLEVAKDKQLALTTEDGKAMYKRLVMIENDNAELLVQQNKDKLQRETDEIKVNGFTQEIAQLHAQLAAAGTLVNVNGQEGLSQELVNLHGQVQQLQAELAEAQKCIPDAMKLPLCDQEVRRQRGLLAQKHAEIVDLKARYAALEQAWQELNDSKVQDDQIIAKKRGGRQYGPQVVRELQEKLDKMQIQLAMNQGPEIDKKNAEIERLRAELVHSNAELQKQKTAKQSTEEVDAQRYFEENVELRKTIEELELELELRFTTEERSDSAMDETPPKANRSTQIGELQQENNGLAVQVQELTAQLAEKKKELDEKCNTFEQEYARFNQVHAEWTLKANLNSGNGPSNEQFQQLQHRCAELEAELASKDQMIESLNSGVQSTDEHIQKMQQKFMDKVRELERATRKVAKLESEQREAHALITKLTDDQQGVQDKWQAAYVELQEWAGDETRNTALVNAFQRVSQLETQLSNAANPAASAQDFDNLKEELDARLTDVKNLKDELEAAGKVLEEEKKKAEAAENKNKALTAINNKLREKVKSAKEEAEKDKSEGIDFEARLPQLQQEALDPTRNPALAEATRKIEELQEQIGKAVALQQAHEQLEKRIPELEAALDGKNDMINALQALQPFHETVGDTGHAEKFSELGEQLRKTIADLEKRLADCHEHGKKLETELHMVNDKLLKAGKAALKGNGHVGIVAGLEKRLADLQAELDAEKNKLPPLPDSDKEGDETSVLKKALDDCHEHGKTLQAELNVKSKELQTIQAALTDAQAELEKLKANVSNPATDSQADLAKTKEQLKQAEENLQEKREDYSRVVKKNDEVNRELTDAVTSLTYTRSFPHGHERLPTSSTGLHCGLYAIIESVKAQMPHLPVPTLVDMQRIIGTVTSDPNNFQAEDLHLTLRRWAEEQQLQQSLQLGIITPDTRYLVLREDGRDTLWLHNDEAQKLQQAVYNHYEGLRAKPCDAGAVEADNSKVLTQRAEERDAAIAQAEKLGENIEEVEKKLADQESKCQAEKAALRLMLDTCDKEKQDLEAKVAELQTQLTVELTEPGSSEKEALQARVAELEKQLEAEKNKAGPTFGMGGSFQAPVFNFSMPGSKKNEGSEQEQEQEQQQQPDTSRSDQSEAASPEIIEATTDEQEHQQTDTPRADRSRAPTPEVGQATTNEPDPSAPTQQDPVEASLGEEATTGSDAMDVDLPDYENTPERKQTNERPADPFGASNPFGGFSGTSTGAPQQPIFDFFQNPSPPTGQAPFLGKATRGANKRHRARGRGGRPEAADYMGTGTGMDDLPGNTSGSGSGPSPFLGSFGTGFNAGPYGTTELALQQQIAELNSELFNARAERNRFEQERNEYQQAWNTSWEEAYKLNQEVQMMAGERQQDKTQFETEKVGMVAEHGNAMAGLTARIDKLESEKTKLEEEVAKLEEKRTEQQSEQEKILEMVKKGDGSKTTKLLSEMNAKLAEQVRELEKENKKQEKSIEDCLEEIESLVDDLDSKRAEVERLTESERLYASALANLRIENNELKEEASTLRPFQGYKDAWVQQNEELKRAHGENQELQKTIAKQQKNVKWTAARLGQLQKEKEYLEVTVKQMGQQTTEWHTLMEKQNEKVEYTLLQFEKARAGKRPNDDMDDDDDDEMFAIEKVYKLEKLVERLLSYRFQRDFMTDCFDKIYEQIKLDQMKGTPATKKHLQELVVEEWLHHMRFILPPSEPTMPGWAKAENLPDSVVVDEEGEIAQSAETREAHEQKVRDNSEENLVQRLKQKIRRLEAELQDDKASAETRDATGEGQQDNLTRLSKELRGKEDEVAELKTRLAEALAAPVTLEDLLDASRQILDRVNSFGTGSASATEEKNAAKQTNEQAKCPCCDCCKCKIDGAVVAGENVTAVPENMVNNLQDTVAELAKMMQDTVKDFQTEVETAKKQLPGPDAMQSDGAVAQLEKELRQAKDMIDSLKMDLSNAQLMLESLRADVNKTESVPGENLDITGRVAEAQRQIRDLQARVDDGKSSHPELYQSKGRAEVLQQQVDYFQKELDQLKQQLTQEREALMEQVDQQREQFDRKLDEERDKAAAMRTQLVTDKPTRHVGGGVATSSGEHQVVQARSFGRRALIALFVAMAISAWCVHTGMEASADLRTGVGRIYHYGRAQTHQVMVFESWGMFGIFEAYQSYVCYCLWRLAFATLGR